MRRKYLTYLCFAVVAITGVEATGVPFGIFLAPDAIFFAINFSERPIIMGHGHEVVEPDAVICH